jgi:endonuclease YncB( thermonuclease family)
MAEISPKAVARFALTTSLNWLGISPVIASSVLSIGDGDAVTVREGSQRIKVRLAYIDAPETSQSPFGMESRRELMSLLPIGSEVTLKTKAVDRYGQALLRCSRVAPTSISP